MVPGPLRSLVPRGACIALTAAGTGTSYGIARSLRDSFGTALRIVAFDTNPPELQATSQLADVSCQIGPAAEPGYTGHLSQLLQTHRVTLWWPVLDQELAIAAEVCDLWSDGAVIAPASDVATLCWDKLGMADWLRSVGLPTPRTWPGDEAAAAGGAVLIKPRRGLGSRGVTKPANRRQLLELLTATEEEMIIQQLCDGPEVTVDAFRGRSHSVEAAICRERLEVKAGVCTKARVFHDGEIEATVLTLGRLLGLDGAYCVQLMRAPGTAAWTITDVNARPGAGTRMSVVCGFDVLSATLLDRWGHDPEPALGPLERERFVVRHYEEDVS
jgi:carbamoyl-phosphate synthase large subunit